MTAVTDSYPFLLGVTGPFACGKTRLCDELAAELRVAKAVTATTRLPRPGEVHGKSYFFYDDGEMQRRIKDGEFVEHAVNNGKIYGTPKSSVLDPIIRGESVIVSIDPKGAETLLNCEREEIRNALILVYLDVDLVQAVRRARSRPGGMSWSEIQTRCRTRWKDEEPRKELFTVISNQDGEFENACSQVKQLIVRHQVACFR